MSKSRKILISAFIVFNFLTMIRVHLPLNDSKFFSTLYRPIDSYLSFFSLYQDWLMFAPNPNRTNAYVSAEVVFSDGTKDSYSFPRPGELSLAEKYSHGERLRKFVTEGVRRDDNSWMWPDTARFVLRQMREKHFDKIPAKVHLYRHWNETADLSEYFRPHTNPIKNYESYRFYTHEVIL